MEVGAVEPQPEIAEVAASSPPHHEAPQNVADIKMLRSEMLQLLDGVASKIMDQTRSALSSNDHYPLNPHIRRYVSHLIGAVHVIESEHFEAGMLDAVNVPDISLSYNDLRERADAFMDLETLPDEEPTVTPLVSRYVEHQFTTSYEENLRLQEDFGL